MAAALDTVVASGASDLHISPGAAPSIRVDGRLGAIEGAPRWSAQKVSEALLSVLSPERLEIFTSDQELDFAHLHGGERFRANFYRQRDSMGAVFRLIPSSIKSLAELGIPSSVGSFAAFPRGLVLVTGPTGSGKSTTIAALVDEVNRTREGHIITVEDPIEFVHEHGRCLVSQREVGRDTQSFAIALRQALRQDPDVILIGELRDLETMAVALTAAETGHLVFATLHTKDASTTIDRMIDVFPPHQQAQVRTQLAATLGGIVSQTLVRKVGGGRAVATEILVATPAVRNLIREGRSHQIPSAMQAGRSAGMQTMDQHLASLVAEQKVTAFVARESAQDVQNLNQLMRNSSQLAGRES
ncbi:MAG: type IV pilus twitching motility protein PilT [Burkholderiaceae bacterium]|nr:type IV pilus twitching motility protein PilT [Microbacteriaceae bacterium]